MLTDPLLQKRYLKHLHKSLELAHKEIEVANDPQQHRLALMYRDVFERSRYTFEEVYGCNLVKAFKKFQDAGHLEIITCGATHGFLPLMESSLTLCALRLEWQRSTIKST